MKAEGRFKGERCVTHVQVAEGSSSKAILLFAVEPAVVVRLPAVEAEDTMARGARATAAGRSVRGGGGG